MDDSINYAEYTVAKKAEGKNLRKRFLFIGLYLIVIIAISVMIAITNGGFALIGGILFVLVIALVFFTWRFVKEERKYEVANAKLKIQEVTGSGKATVVFENFVSEFSVIAPMTDEYKEKFEKADEIKDYRGNSKSKDSYFARLEKDGKSTVVCFEATNKMLKVMTFYNKKATVVTLMSH